MKQLLSHIVETAGAGLVSYGAWLFQPAAGYVAAGAFLLAFSVGISRGGGK